jgi:hypothetical protein
MSEEDAGKERALVNLAVGANGELELVLAEEVWAVLKEAMKNEAENETKSENIDKVAEADAHGKEWKSVRVSLGQLGGDSRSLRAAAKTDQPPCPPLKIRKKP